MNGVGSHDPADNTANVLGTRVIEPGARYPAARGALPDELGRALWPDAMLVNAPAGRTIVALGDETIKVYIILEGRLQVALFSSGGGEVVLRNLGAGAMFGDLAAIDGQPRSASIVALTDCVLASIPGEVFRDAVCRTPESACWIARRFAGQIRALSQKLFELNVLAVPSRLHCELLRLCHSGSGAEAGVIEPFPTHAELASRIGSHREAVTREMGYLSKRGIVRQSGRRTVVDIAALSDLVSDVAGDVGQPHDWSGG